MFSDVKLKLSFCRFIQNLFLSHYFLNVYFLIRIDYFEILTEKV